MTDKPKILVVDDEQRILFLLEEGLSAAGYEVLTASSGSQGVIRALHSRPSLILLDLMMPQLDGWQTLQRLRRHPEMAKIPVVFLTARSDTKDVFRSQQMGVLDYFIKPIEIGELVKFIPRYIQRQ